MGTIANTVDFKELAAQIPESKGGPRIRRFLATVNMAASYATGGDTLTIPTGVGTFRGVNLLTTETGANRYTWNGDKATPKIKAYVIATGAEVAATTNLSAVALDVELIYEQ